MELTNSSSGAVIKAADDHAHGVTHKRVVEAGELPRAQVAGKNENSLAAGLGGEEMLDALCADPATGVLGRIAGHAAEFDELPAQVAEEAAEDSLPCLGGKLGKRQLKVAPTDSVQAQQREIRRCGDEAHHDTGDRSRQAAEQARHRCYQPVFDPLPHGQGKGQV